MFLVPPASSDQKIGAIGEKFWSRVKLADPKGKKLPNFRVDKPSILIFTRCALEVSYP